MQPNTRPQWCRANGDQNANTVESRHPLQAVRSASCSFHVRLAVEKLAGWCEDEALHLPVGVRPMDTAAIIVARIEGPGAENEDLRTGALGYLSEGMVNIRATCGTGWDMPAKPLALNFQETE